MTMTPSDVALARGRVKGVGTEPSALADVLADLLHLDREQREVALAALIRASDGACDGCALAAADV